MVFIKPYNMERKRHLNSSTIDSSFWFLASELSSYTFIKSRAAIPIIVKSLKETVESRKHLEVSS